MPGPQYQTVTGAGLRDILKGGFDIAKRVIPGGIDDLIIDGLGLGSGDPRGAGLGRPSCSPGYVTDAQGRCVKEGFAGAVQRFLPGGQTGMMPSETYGNAVYGRYGVALEPAQVPSYRLKCPPGMLLGTDNLCYDSLTKKERKWKPGAKPFLTGGQMNAIRTATRLRKKGKKLTKMLK